MNDDLNNKERVIKGILDELQYQPNTDQLWANLEPQLPVKKKRRLLPFWWMSGLALLTLCSIGFGYTLANMNSKVNASPNNTQDIAESKNALAEAEQASKVTTPITSNSSNSVEAESSKNTISKSENLKQVVITKPQTTITVSSTVLNKNMSSNSTIEESTLSNTVIKNSQLANTSSSKTTKSIDRGIAHQPIVLVQNEENILTNKKNDFINELSLLGLADLDLFNIKARNINPATANTQIKPITKSRRYFTSIRGGVGQSINNIKIINSTGEFEPSIFNNEKSMPALNLSFDLGTYMGSWKIFTGLSYTNMVSRYTRNEESLTTSTGTGTKFIIIDDTGNLTSQDGTINTTNVTNHSITWHRKHSLLDIHIGAGRDLVNLGDFTLGMDAIIGYNLWSKHTGYYFDDAEEPLQKFVSGEENIYRKNMGLSAAIMLPITFDIGRQAAVSLTPSWRLQADPITITNNFYSIKNSQLGLQFGITYRP